MIKNFRNILIGSFLFFMSCSKDQSEDNPPQITKSKITEEKKEVVPEEVSEKEKMEVEIFRIINAFKEKDEKTLNSYVNNEVGFYLIPGPGTLLHFERAEKIDFKNAYINYQNFGGKLKYKPDLIEVKTLPQYRCESFTWDRLGLFVAENQRVFSTILKRQKMGGWKVEKGDRPIAKKMDPITTTVLLAEKNSDVTFGIAKYEGKYIITYLDLSKTYCDV